MKTQLIIIGDELLAGNTVDTNTQWLASFLQTHGLSLNSVSIVPDKEKDLKSALSEAIKEHDLIFTSGGMGPTPDDITKNVIASFFGRKIKFSEAAKEIVEANYKRKEKICTKSQNFYDLLPAGAIPFNNPTGLAPGIVFEEGAKMVLCAPGVPKEFQAIVKEEFLPYIQAKHSLPDKTTNQICIRTKNIPEESIFFKLCPTLWKDLEQFGKVSSLPQALGVDIVVTINCLPEELETKRREIIKLINSGPLNDHVWQIGNLPLPELIVKRAKEKNLTFCFAESCTGGLSSSLITDIAGSSAVFHGSVICYANGVKTNVLNVSEDSIEAHGLFSKETAMEMAQGARATLNADIAISWTGVAGPDGGTADAPVGTVAIGHSTKEKSGSETFFFGPDSRKQLKEKFCKIGLFLLLDLVEKH